jgi:hypothetical protein
LACGGCPGTGGFCAPAGADGVGPCCWIKVAFCWTEGGKAGPIAAAAGVPAGAAAPLRAPAPPGAAAVPAGAAAGAAAGAFTIVRLMVLMTVVLWMLAKMTLLGGGAT